MPSLLPTIAIMIILPAPCLITTCAAIYNDVVLSADSCGSCCVTVNQLSGLLEHSTCIWATNQRWVVEPVPGQGPWVRIRTVPSYNATAPKYWTVSDIALDSVADIYGARLQVLDLLPASASQQFKLLGGGNGQIQIGNPPPAAPAGGYCVDVYRAWPTDGGVLWTYPCSAAHNEAQQFSTSEWLCGGGEAEGMQFVFCLGLVAGGATLPTHHAY